MPSWISVIMKFCAFYWPVGSGGLRCITVPNFIKIRLSIVGIFYFYFQDGSCSLFCICGAHFGTNHGEYLEVFSVVQNLVGMHAVVCII